MLLEHLTIFSICKYSCILHEFKSLLNVTHFQDMALPKQTIWKLVLTCLVKNYILQIVQPSGFSCRTTVCKV